MIRRTMMSSMIMRASTAAIICLLAMVPAAMQHALAKDSGGAPVPDALKVPAGQVLTFSAKGDGVQIYACLPLKEDPTHYSWTLKAPEATLRDDSGKILGKHYAGPTWEALDGSKVVGEVTTKVDAPDAAAIPWLLLHVKSTSGSGIFTDTVSVQRLNTTGGKSPAAVCDESQAGKEIRIPYTATYRFYGPPRSS
jgi:hypothetical protein